MAIGGLLSAGNVAEMMSHRIARMNHGQGLAANPSTGLLVILASTYGLPVSTRTSRLDRSSGIGLIASTANIRS
jgi:PiT family inorganic phosphate transporter